MKEYRFLKTYLYKNYTKQVDGKRTIYLNTDGKPVAYEQDGSVTMFFVHGIDFNMKYGTGGLHYTESFISSMTRCTRTFDYYTRQREAIPKPFYESLPGVWIKIKRNNIISSPKGSYIADTMTISDEKPLTDITLSPIGVYKNETVTTLDGKFQITGITKTYSSSHIWCHDLEFYVFSEQKALPDYQYDGSAFKRVEKMYQAHLSYLSHFKDDDDPPQWAIEEKEEYEKMKTYSYTALFTTAQITKCNSTFTPKSVHDVLECVYTNRAGYFSGRGNNTDDLNGTQIVRVAVCIYEYLGARAADGCVNAIKTLIKLKDLSATNFIITMQMLDKYDYNVPEEKIAEICGRKPSDLFGMLTVAFNSESHNKWHRYDFENIVRAISCLNIETK
jgi:hypothetical protein